MNIRIGFDIEYTCSQPTPMILTLNVHSSRASFLLTPDRIVTNPAIPLSGYRDLYGNWVTRLVLPPGDTLISNEALIFDDGEPDPVDPEAQQVAVEYLPEEALVYLLGSRYCETDLMMNEAWALFGSGPSGWARVQAICDFVHQHVKFGYEHASNTMTASQVYQQRAGVCRDYAHLAVTFCRCMNIPARYCTGYLSDIGQPPPHGEMDFAAWFEAYLDGKWHVFDPRNNRRLIGRVLMARGRDATDVSLSNSFGETLLKRFEVRAEEVTDS
ncbi:MAG: transglutaminase family protein [Halieaceae bacterium]|jgi:transglutaminase-like putative cysteine protease|nr:transglutaminase family protein [Halieaceae bacterium]